VVSPYLGIVIMLALASAFVGLTIITSMLVGPGRYNRAKYDSYECGIQPTPQPLGGGRFPVKYYITAMLFIIFDIEIVFLYPWAVSFDQMGAGGDGAVRDHRLPGLPLCAASRRTRVGLIMKPHERSEYRPHRRGALMNDELQTYPREGDHHGCREE
jgi:NADH-quinone oxidoreductase subunit A